MKYTPAQYLKAIAAFFVTAAGALVTGGVLDGDAAVMIGSVSAGVVAFVAVFATPNAKPDVVPRKRTARRRAKPATA